MKSSVASAMEKEKLGLQLRLKNELRRMREKINKTRMPWQKARLIRQYVTLLEMLEFEETEAEKVFPKEI